jgi:hypothetical protein
MAVLIRKLAMAAGLALALAGAAFAGGDDIDATGDFQDEGPSYFGFVRDHRGSPVSDAVVKLIPKSGDSVEVKTNVLGLYRSHVRKDVEPKDVEVSCAKTGFRQTRVYRRTSSDAQARVIETECTLQRL